ncbi:2-hydroxyacyl-CoA dehydratase [Oscillibacter hominis]|uniref:2-hydroxyacyl-CoA dehydratase n=1 Tax=Oscillibacter hominis TaxID=2763056 RepID=A0A7G9B532_9FIRM|nr:(R)-2-hydroxyglutaryl-CoA dehydratase subunit beta [Oscillibacter hominis]QNL44663.1 2-hydroxyacyl-CoA dehydratase [Oscillibacter hominis]
MSIDTLVQEFSQIAANPKAQLEAYKKQGKKCIGVMPYYAPEELVDAAGMVPFGMWGSNDKTISRAKEYCATFYCTIAQLDLEMLLDGTMDLLDGVITPTICDTLRPMSQNIRVAMSEKLPCIFLAHPQYRRPEFGLKFCVDQYTNVRTELEKIAGAPIADEAILNSIKVYNKSRAARREFAKLANEHCDVITPTKRSAVLKAAWFMPKAEYTEKLQQLNSELKALPVCKWKGTKVVTSGIICDNPKLLEIFEENNIAIAADDVAHESRAFRVDAPESGDPILALAHQFADQDYDVLLYDEHSSENRRGEFVANLVKESGAQGLVLFMQQFCDPEEMEYPYLKKALDSAGIPHIKLGVDQQMRDFGQARTAIQAFADVISL